MKRITINLRGWADSWISEKENANIDFVLQCAMYKVTGNCDWVFDIKTKGTKGSDVRYPWVIEVEAERCSSAGYETKINRKTKTLEVREFKFKIDSLTMENIYEKAMEAIPNGDRRLS